MIITLEMPLGTALKLKKLAADFASAVDKQDPLALAIAKELEARGIDPSKIKIV